MEKLLESVKARSEQFTTIEIQAEVLRQQIQDLERKGIHNRATPQTQDEKLLKALKTRLATLQGEAELASQGRTVLGEQSKLLLAFRKHGDFPAFTGDMMDTTRKWIDGLENQQNKRHQRQIDRLKQHWPRADWGRRLTMLGSLGRRTTRRYVIDKPIYRLGRTVARWGSRLFKKGP